MNFLLYSSMMPSTRCSSAPVPSTVVTRAWVSPRWNRAEPCARGNRPTSHLIDRRSLGPRPSGRLPSRISSRTTRSSTALKAALIRAGVTSTSAGTGLGAASSCGAASGSEAAGRGGAACGSAGTSSLMIVFKSALTAAFRSAFITICLVSRSCSPYRS